MTGPEFDQLLVRQLQAVNRRSHKRVTLLTAAIATVVAVLAFLWAVALCS